MRIMTAALLLVSLMPAAAMAERKSNQSADMGDPNRIICKRVEVIGSRIAQKKTCHTAAEWASVRREQRRTIDRIQALKPSF